MNRSLILLLALAGGFAAGVIWLFDLQFESGDAYRMYSSHRADPAGTKALHDSLAATGKFEVRRNYQPLEFASIEDSTVLVIGLYPEISEADAARLQALAKRGNRVVVGLRSEEDYKQKDDAAILRRWQVKLPTQEKVIEKRVDKGAVVVVPDGDAFTNSALATGADTALLLRALGPGARVVFDEAHLGMIESGSVVGLARRYRLQGFAVAAALWAALFLWRSTSAFPPPATQAGAGGIAGRTSASGLAGLLRQNVEPARLPRTAWELWLKSGAARVTASRRAEAESAMQTVKDPLAALAAMHRALAAKGRNDTRATQDRA